MRRQPSLLIGDLHHQYRVASGSHIAVAIHQQLRLRHLDDLLQCRSTRHKTSGPSRPWSLSFSRVAARQTLNSSSAAAALLSAFSFLLSAFPSGVSLSGTFLASWFPWLTLVAATLLAACASSGDATCSPISENEIGR